MQIILRCFIYIVLNKCYLFIEYCTTWYNMQYIDVKNGFQIIQIIDNQINNELLYYFLHSL